MIWTIDNPPDIIKHKSKDVIQACVSAANLALSKGQTKEEAEFAGLNAAKRLEQSTVVKQVKPKIPQHVLAVVNKAVEPYIETVDDKPESIVSVEFDDTNHLVVTLSSGKTLRTKRAIDNSNIEQHVAVQVNPVFEYVRFDTTATEPAHDEGLLFYDKNDHCLAYYNEDSNIKVSLGREELVRVYNNNAFNIPDGEVVYINGAFGGFATVNLAIASSKTSVESLLGVCTGTILPNSHGYVCISGNVNGIDTSSYIPGTVLYLSSVTTGKLTNVPPLQPNFSVEVCTVLNQSSTIGSLLVRVDKKKWFPSLQLIHPSTVVLPTTPTVFKPSTTSYNDGFTYDSVTGEVTFNNSGTYGLTMNINALPSASNKSLYFYLEINVGAGWVPITYSGRKEELLNNFETQIVFTGNSYFPTGSKIRLVLWSQPTITLLTSDLPDTVPGTVKLPAFRATIA